MMKHYWNKFSDLLGDTLLHPQYFIKLTERQSLKETIKIANGTFLDIGCGRQWYRGQIEPKVLKYFALDNPKTSVKYDSLYPVDLRADVTKIPLPNKTVDVAIMIMVLEHLPDPETALKEICRVLKKNGKLIICTVENYPGHDTPYNYYHYTKSGLVELLNRSQFKISKIQSFGNYWETAVVFFNVHFMQLIKKHGIVGLFIFIFVYPVMILFNVLAMLLGRRKITEDFALSHLVIAQRKS